MRLTNLDIDILRSLVAAVELGSFSRAAERMGRSQSAISLQMQKLASQLGTPLFKKPGRTLVATDAGVMMLSYARKILELNDEAVAAARGATIEGAVRFGLPQDLADAWLPAVLARFARAHPNILTQTVIDRNLELIDHLSRGSIDFALAFGDYNRANKPLAAEFPLAWVSARDFTLRTDQPVPLLVLDAPCMFRQAAINALQEAGMPWRVVFTSPNLIALWAAAQAGLGVTVRTELGLPPQLDVLGPAAGLPALSSIGFGLYASGDPMAPAVKRLQTILIETLHAVLPARTLR